MLAGVITDYKESERLLPQIVGGFVALHDVYLATHAAGKPIDLPHIREQHLAALLEVEDWLMQRASFLKCLEATDRLATMAGGIARVAGDIYTPDMLAGVRMIRGACGRIHTIRTSSFIQAGYVLLYALVGITLTLLLVAGFQNPGAQYLVTGFISLLYLYLLQMIRDLDNPFDYAPDGTQRGLDEISPAVVVDYRKAMQVAWTPATSAKPAPAPLPSSA